MEIILIMKLHTVVVPNVSCLVDLAYMALMLAQWFYIIQMVNWQLLNFIVTILFILIIVVWIQAFVSILISKVIALIVRILTQFTRQY